MVEQTHRWGLPLIVPGQAQKEMTHNEALAMLDMAVHPSVIAVGVDTPPVTAEAGACWIVGGSPAGAWTGYADHLAGWTAGGWRFLAPRAGMVVHLETGGTAKFFSSGSWVVAEPVGIAPPTGGDVVDSQARSAVAAILDTLRGQGLVLPE